MGKPCKVVVEGGTGEVIEKKSRFIATVIPVSTEEEALSKKDELKKKYWDARHNCFAYIIGTDGQQMRSSDDGEPQGTAGHPMLDVLINEELHDVLVVVTRYFGGTLLGTGGLVRAYQQATKEGLNNSKLAKEVAGVCVSIEADYTYVGKIQYIMGEMGLRETSSEYSNQVKFTLDIPEDLFKRFTDQLTEETSGKVLINVIEKKMLLKLLP